MRNLRISILPFALAAFALAGCEGGDSPQKENEAVNGTEAESPPAPAEEPAREMIGNVQLSVVETPEHGMYITDAEGLALYLLKADSAGASTCFDACAQAWPPFLAAEGSLPASHPAVQESLIGTIQREPGSMQVTYNGHPLYYYAEDREAGDARGQDVTDEWGQWYLVTPQGEPLEGNDSGADL